MGVQVRVSHWLPAAAVCAAQLATPVGPVVLVTQVTVVVVLPDTVTVGPGAAQAATATVAEVVTGLDPPATQLVAIQLFPAVAALGVQVATTLDVTSGVQVVVTPEANPDVQEAGFTGVGPVVVFVQTTVGILPAADALQVATLVGPLIITALQVVVVHAFVALAVAGVQAEAATTVGPVVMTGQLIRPATGVQLPVGVLLSPLYELSCDVLFRVSVVVCCVMLVVFKICVVVFVKLLTPAVT